MKNKWEGGGGGKIEDGGWGGGRRLRRDGGVWMRTGVVRSTLGVRDSFRRVVAWFWVCTGVWRCLVSAVFQMRGDIPAGHSSRGIMESSSSAPHRSRSPRADWIGLDWIGSDRIGLHWITRLPQKRRRWSVVAQFVLLHVEAQPRDPMRRSNRSIEDPSNAMRPRTLSIRG